MKIIKKVYIKALKIPWEEDVDFFRKNETVRGIIGKTQGVNKANNPPINPSIKMFKKE
jgi:hypothetical protein|tara:strand:+ start:601 stop:774 length:174 start_codon:yes stop_codon:yes gene_type:complete